MRVDDLRMGLPRSLPQRLAPVVRHERLWEPREGSSVPGEEARHARLSGGGGHPRERGDDALAVKLEDPLLLAAHEIDVELPDADGGELTELVDVLVDLAGDAEAVHRLIVDECGVRGSGLGVMLVVVARAIAHVRGEIRRQPLLAVSLHEIDDMIRHERGEPPDAVADLVARPKVSRRGAHDRDRAGVAPGLARALAEEPDAPADQARIGELDDGAVGYPSGELERLRPVPRDPDRKAMLFGPPETQLRSFVRRAAAFAEIADHVRGLLEHREVGRLLTEDPPGRTATADAEIHPAARQLLEDREDARRHRGFAGRRVRHARPEPHPLGVLRHQRQQDVGLLPEHMTVEEPAVPEAGALSEPRQRRDPLERMVRFEREAEVHEVRKCRRALRSHGYFAPITHTRVFGSAAPNQRLVPVSVWALADVAG